MYKRHNLKAYNPTSAFRKGENTHMKYAYVYVSMVNGTGAHTAGHDHQMGPDDLFSYSVTFIILFYRYTKYTQLRTFFFLMRTT